MKGEEFQEKKKKKPSARRWERSEKYVHQHRGGRPESGDEMRDQIWQKDRKLWSHGGEGLGVTCGRTKKIEFFGRENRITHMKGHSTSPRTNWGPGMGTKR